MRVGIIQSNYIPWRGYFDFIRSVDTFVLYDDVEFSKGSWRNRNRIKTPHGSRWLTVPVHHRLHQLIEDTRIDESSDWRKRHCDAFEEHYRLAPHCDAALRLLEGGCRTGGTTISELNIVLITEICRYLGISTPLVRSSDFRVTGAKTGRLIELLRAVGATCYVSGPAAKAYLEEDLFREAAIRLEYKSYDYQAYPQLWGGFDNNVTVLDLIANLGPDSSRFIVSGTENEVAVR